MRRSAILLTLLITITSLTGCSSSTSPSSAAAAGDAGSKSSSPAAVSSTSPSTGGDALASAATKIGCTGWALSADIAPGVDEWGTCTWQATNVRLYLISSDANYKTFVAAMAGYGVTEAHVVRAGQVVGALDDQTKLPALKTALAG